MELIKTFFDIFMHLDKHLAVVIHNYGVWTYLILFLIIFCETGLVITPILPGDSLLFAAGALASTSSLDVGILFGLLSFAAIAGNTTNYWIGHAIGPKIFDKQNVPLLNREYLERTHRFYEKHGGKTIVIARFIPIIRTFAPFVAGIGAMTHWRFSLYNVAAGIAWVGIFIFAGYYFGNIAVVKRNFTIVIFAIIFISVLPGIIQFLRHRRGAN
ncbi:MAG TPA: DedA family protein [Candidatus Sulfobium mesophilum]|jgi:membrane-associated protein|nr:DedA family protein [Candidatus Sulfobium mesophilum]